MRDGCSSQYFETYPIHIYLTFEKTDSFMYQIVWNVGPSVYSPLIFCTHLLLVVRQISQSIHWIPREQAASKNLWTKMCMYWDTSEKWGLSYIHPEKWVYHILFTEKRGESYTWQRWKRGPFGTHIHTMSYIESSPPTPSTSLNPSVLPPTPPSLSHTHTPRGDARFWQILMLDF